MKRTETPTLSGAASVTRFSTEAAQADLFPVRRPSVNPERSFGRGRPNAAPKLGGLHHARLETIFDTALIAGWLDDGRYFRAPLLCVDGDATIPHWVHTTTGRVLLSPAVRQRLFS